VRSAEEFDAVKRLIAAGINDCAIARQTGIPRRTVCDWRYGGLNVRTRLPAGSSACGTEHNFLALPREAYSYLLGLYLGDGYITRHRRGVYALSIACADAWPGLISAAKQAMRDVLPASSVFGVQRPGMTEDKLDQILSRQMPDAEKRAKAHFVVETDKGLDHAFEQVKAIVTALRAKRNA